MKLFSVGMIIFGVVHTWVYSAMAQLPTNASTEFITSSSPLPDGSMVTTTYYPKSGASPTTSLSPGNGIIPSGVTPLSPQRPTEQSAILGRSLASITANNMPSAIHTAQLPNMGVVPVQGTSAVPVQMPTWGSPYAGPRPYLAPQLGTRNTVYSYPTTVAQQLPMGTVYPYPAASLPPTLSGTPSNSLPMPYTATRRPYQPLIRFQNLPPGTYLGQGLIGQPTAYVDGQPFRNLLRYVFP